MCFLTYADPALNTVSHKVLCQPLHGLPACIDNHGIIEATTPVDLDNG